MTDKASRILIVEDEAELLDEVASYFKRRGENVLTASCFNDGLRLLEDATNPVDVLISDARMPDGNGLDLIRTQTEKTGGRCICILMTGHLEQSQIANDLGGVKVFFKPFAVSALHREVRAAMTGGVPGAMPGGVVRAL
jgi:two-component system cell cycle sensor histidine kinase/response regulator CckA